MRIKVWTEAYNPMAFGKLKYPLATEIDIQNWFDAGEGFLCAKITSPDGLTEAVVEMKSGGIVGSTMEQVMQDISECDDINIIKNQIEDGIKRINSPSARIVSEKEFWGIYKKS